VTHQTSWLESTGVCGVQKNQPVVGSPLHHCLSCVAPLGYAAVAAVHAGLVSWTCSWQKDGHVTQG